jgi:HSP20 family protein
MEDNMALIRYEPLVNPLDGLFNDLFRAGYAPARQDEPAPIRFDVRETGEAYTVAAELPGVKKEDIQVEIEGNEVTISAETKRATEQKEGDKWLRTERYFGKVARRFALPQEVDEAKAAAKFDNGLLELTLPKKAATAGRKLAVQ